MGKLTILILQVAIVFLKHSHSMRWVYGSNPGSTSTRMLNRCLHSSDMGIYRTIGKYEME